MMFVLFSDFGSAGPYVGQMKLVLNSGAPAIPVIDLFHNAPRFDLRKSACLLARYSSYVPTDAVVIAVVDPGVGTSRGFLRVRSRGRTFFGPDNGLFEYVLREDVDAVESVLDWEEGIASSSFYGRDVFCPMALRHSAGFDLADSGKAALRFPEWPDDLLEIVYVDEYGNLVSGYRADRCGDADRFQVCDQVISYAHTFGEVTPGELFWYRNSNGLIEFAANQDSAADKLRVGLGQEISRV